MGNFSRDTFNELNRYVGVRLQQGVPIVDADWNEMDDIRRYELAAFLRWYVGNGVPKGNDGFRIEQSPPSGSANDFTIKGGDGTIDAAGRCLVEGWDIINPDNTNYTGQALYKKDDLAQKWKVPVLPPLTAPQGADRVDFVYLDVWEREVNSQEDDNLVNHDIGIETCVRLKREWAVRVAEGAGVPVPSVGHKFYTLAVLNRKANKPTIEDKDITDLRQTVPNLADIERRLSLLEQHLLRPSFDFNHPFDPGAGSVGDEVILHGNNFNMGEVKVMFGTAPATVIGQPTESTIVATVPPGIWDELFITVTTAFGSANSSKMFLINAAAPSFAAPGSQLSDAFGFPGMELTLFGKNFDVPGPKVEFVQLAGNIMPKGIMPQVKSSSSIVQGTVLEAKVISQSMSKIVVEVPAATSQISGLRVTVMTAGGSVTSDDTFDLDPNAG